MWPRRLWLVLVLVVLVGVGLLTRPLPPCPAAPSSTAAVHSESSSALLLLPTAPPPLVADAVDDRTAAYLVHHLRVLAAEVKRLAAAAAGGPAGRAALPPPHQGLEARAAVTHASAVCRQALPAARRVVVTLNLWNVNGDWPTRRRAVADALRAAGADVVALQEVRYAGAAPAAGGAHQLAELAALLPDLPYTAYLRVGPMDVGHEEGLGVLSRYPLTERAPVLLETGAKADATNRRRALVVEVATPGSPPLTLVNVHLTYHDLGQCEAVLLLRAAADALGPRVVVLGDMNTYLDFAWPMDYLTGELPASLVRHAVNPCAPGWAEAPPPAPNLADVWTAVHGGWPLGNTYPALRGGTTEDPSRPDRVLVRGLHPCDAALLKPPPGGTPLSDHHGVVATLVES